jgi:hypothetical protein
MQAHRFILCILGLGLVCFAYRFSFKNRAAATSVSAPPSEPSALLAYADEMARAGNWLGARAHFAKAEHLFSLKHDEPNRLYCAISSVRANLENSSLPEASAELNRFLQNPSVQRNPRILLRALVAKGTLNFNSIQLKRTKLGPR